MRIILVTGKGGVGKTSVAAATAVRAAGMGHRTLVTSTDPAHSLGDTLGVALGDKPIAVTEGLEAEQLDPHVRLEQYWAEVRAYLVSLLEWGGLAEVQAEELSVLPGLEELFALVDIRRHARAGLHDVVVVDCAPTAETLRLLALPDALGWYLERAFGLERSFRLVRPVLGRVTSMPLPSDAVMGAVQQLYETLTDVRELLLDGDRTTVRLVTNPERVVVAETRRTFAALHLFGYRVDAVVVNRLLPDAVADPHFHTWKQRQAEHLASIREDFRLPILTAPLAADEPVGPASLDGLAAAIHGQADPTDVLHRAQPVQFDRDGDEFRLTVDLPCTGAEEVSVHHRADELYVRVGPHRRSLVLPAVLHRCDVVGAAVADGRLDVRFAVAPAPRGSEHPGRGTGDRVS